MTATYQLSLEELSVDFLKQLKQMHRAGKVTMTVEAELEQDETTFLLSNPKNREILLRSKEQAEKGNVIEVDIDKFLEKI